MQDASPHPRGRREANKDVVRTALRNAARDLFAEHGYEATTVRQIAAAANVTERTFYRYFDGKQGLLADESLAWAHSLGEAIRDRPADEPPLLAVMQAMRETIGATQDGFGPVHLWLFSSQPRPFATIRRFSPRPYVRLEHAIADALQARDTHDAHDTHDTHDTRDTHERTGDDAARRALHRQLEPSVLARVAVATLRAAVIHARSLDERDDSELADRVDATILQAFAILGAHAAELQ